MTDDWIHLELDDLASSESKRSGDGKPVLAVSIEVEGWTPGPAVGAHLTVADGHPDVRLRVIILQEFKICTVTMGNWMCDKLIWS